MRPSAAASGVTAATASGVTAMARISAAPDGRGGTALPVLAGDGPLALRRTRTTAPYTQVTVVGAMSAPLGGDRLRLEAAVTAGAALRVTGAAATVALPARTGDTAHYDTVLTVGADAVLHWLPEPMISARNSDLRMTTRVDLHPTAGLVLREEQVLGRTGEPPGRLTTRLTVHRGGWPLLDQELCFGPGAPGWDGGAVLGGHRAVGQLLIVDPAFQDSPPAARQLGEAAVATPLAGPALLVTAVAADGLELRRALDTLGGPPPD